MEKFQRSVTLYYADEN
jgi:hypothetical protein